jgi:Ca2+-binding RTX toxin-like protein
MLRRIFSPFLKGYGTVKDLDAAMTLDGTLKNQVLSFTNTADTLTGKQLHDQFEQILFSWAGVSTVDPASRGQYVDARHLAVIEKFYGGAYVDTTNRGVVSANPNYDNGPRLEAQYHNMLTSMMTDFLKQTPVSKATLAQNPSLVETSKFWPLMLLSSQTADGFDTAMQLIHSNAPASTNIDAFYSYYESMTVALLGAIPNNLNGNVAAFKASYEHLDRVEQAFVYGLVDNMKLAYGTSVSDALNGTNYQELLVGFGGGDTINAGGGNDYIFGLGGNDSIDGQGGDDIYFFGAGHGDDIIYDGMWEGGADKLVLGKGLDQNNLKIARAGADMILSFNGYSGSVTLQREDALAQRGVEYVEFGNGAQWTRSQLMQAYVDQEIKAGKTAVTGFSINGDLFVGTARSETFTGYGADDTYVYNVNGGNDTIVEGMWEGGADKLIFGAGLTQTNLKIVKSGVDLLLSFTGSLGSINLKNEDMLADRGVEQFQFGNGVQWTRSQLMQSYIDQEIKAGKTTVTGFDLNNDLFTGSSKAETFIGGLGNDVFHGNAGSDTLNGGDGSDTAVYAAGTGSVRVNLSTTAQSLNGQTVQAGKAIDGLGGTDTLSGIENITISTAGASFIRGSAVNNTITGSNAYDWIHGDAGNDILKAGGGNDVLYGGLGLDDITGGAGSDKFVFNKGDGRDIIRDYEDGLDKLQVLGTGAAFSGLSLVSSNGGTEISYNGEAIFFLSGINKAVLGSTDFLFV